MLECCLNERTYNPYYALLAGRLCGHSHNHKFTLQYAMWDQFKQLEQTEVREGEERVFHTSSMRLHC